MSFALPYGLSPKLVGGIAGGLAVVVLLFIIYSKGMAEGRERERRRFEPVVSALQADLGQCHQNTAALEADIKAQNDAVAALEREGQARASEAAKAVSDARKATATAQKRAADLLSRPAVGVDACARVENADERVLRSLGQ